MSAAAAAAAGGSSSSDESLSDRVPYVVRMSHLSTQSSLASDDLPRYRTPSLVGRMRYHGVVVGMPLKEHYLGEEAQSKRGILRLHSPVSFGHFAEKVEEFPVPMACAGKQSSFVPSKMDLYLAHILQEHREPAQGSILVLPEADVPDAADRLRMGQLLFEELQVGAASFQPQSVLDLYGSDIESGVVLHVGHQQTTACVCSRSEGLISRPIFSSTATGWVMEQQAREDFGAPLFTTSGELMILRDIKEKHGVVRATRDPTRDVEQRQYEMPDGNQITVGNVLADAAECFFGLAADQAALVDCGVDEDGNALPRQSVLEVAQARAHRASEATRNDFADSNRSVVDCLVEAVKAEPLAVQMQLWNNVVLAGGNSNLPGFVDRLVVELHARSHAAADSIRQGKPHSSVDRRFTTFIGGSVFAQLPDFLDRAVTREEWDEEGDAVLFRKCPSPFAHTGRSLTKAAGKGA